MRRLLLLLVLALPLHAEVSIHIVEPLTMEAGNRLVWRVYVSSDTAVEDLGVSISAGGSPIVGVSDGCVIPHPQGAACTVDLAPATSRELVITVQAPATLGHFQFYASAGGVHRYGDAIFGHEYLVTNTADSGPGSLRQALLDVTRDCPGRGEPCEVVFRVDGPVPAEGWFTFRPQSPFPTIRGTDVVIDGRTQTRHTFDTNPSGGPEVFLDGSAAGAGHGLLAHAARLRVTDVAIGNFAGNGIEARDTYVDIYRNYLGLDPSGVKAAPNGLRGVQLDASGGMVEDNVLSGNLRAGGFFTGQAGTFLRVQRNLVGIGADGVTPLGNGASGLFFHKTAVGYGFAEARENVIGYNAHAGIGVSLAAMGDFAENSFRGNAGRPIDVGLDGPTRGTVMGLPGQGGVVGAPVIETARFENGGTVVTGHLAAPPTSVSTSRTVYLYADGELVGIAIPQNLDFTLRIERDLRGRAISGATYGGFVYNGDFPALGTSEVGEAVVVE
ncbi:MAG TPA: hypothetical protein VEK57_06505 [Thermoanaerobaculia bacterium]|nr:hypothetical protein [Thermoanaerobaculia bacterium]